jgi:uncharacterized membrane protein
MTNKNISKSKQADLPDEISPEIAMVIKDLPEDKRNAVLKAITITKQRHYSGPLPDGENIKIYDDIIPNGGDRLMKTVEKQLDHRITLENISLKRSFNQSSTGQWMGFVIAVLFGLIAWDLAKNGHELTAQILGAVDLVALVTVFITGRSTSK